MTLRAVLLAVLLALPLSAPRVGIAQAAPVAGTFADPAMEARARNLQRQLRCLVCQGESIDESGSDFAADARRQVRRLMAQGRSDQQIEDFLVARYGDFILMKPPVQPDTWLLWSGPLIVLLGAGAVAAGVIRQARRRVSSSERAENP